MEIRNSLNHHSAGIQDIIVVLLDVRVELAHLVETVVHVRSEKRPSVANHGADSAVDLGGLLHGLLRAATGLELHELRGPEPCARFVRVRDFRTDKRVQRKLQPVFNPYFFRLVLHNPFHQLCGEFVGLPQVRISLDEEDGGWFTAAYRANGDPCFVRAFGARYRRVDGDVICRVVRKGFGCPVRHREHKHIVSLRPCLEHVLTTEQVGAFAAHAAFLPFEPLFSEIRILNRPV